MTDDYEYETFLWARNSKTGRAVAYPFYGSGRRPEIVTIGRRGTDVRIARAMLKGKGYDHFVITQPKDAIWDESDPEDED